jgi:hypothetical protein
MLFTTYGSGCYSNPTPLKVVANDCLTPTINLKAQVDSTNKPSNAYVSIHTNASVSDANRLSNTVVTPSGTPTSYYVTYEMLQDVIL